MMKMNKREFLWRFGLPAAVMLGGLLLGLGAGILMDKIELRQAGEAQTLPAEAPADGIGRITAARYLGGARTAMPERAARIAPEHYTEGEGPAPEWWNPGEPMAAEWIDRQYDNFGETSGQVSGKSEEKASCGQVTEANKEAGSGDSAELSQGAEQVVRDTDVPCSAQQSDLNPIQRTDAGCPDWNVDTTVYGWDGRRAEAWELDLYSRIMYLEFWGTSPECCEAGADSMLRLWESGYFGSTLGGVLSAVTETGAYCYSTYPAVWAAEYDPDGLAEMRALCAERFSAGPEWDAAFFQLGGYPDWACPMYQVDNVFFSTGWGW